MGRRTEGRAVIADYSVWTVELSRDELMIILDVRKTTGSTEPNENSSFYGRNVTSTEGMAG